MKHYSENLKRLPPYLFNAINLLKQQAYKKKLDVIDLAMGNPDLPTPKAVVDRLCETVREHPNTHRYPQAKGMPKFRKAITDFYQRRFGVKLDYNHEALALIGSKEGVAHLLMAHLNPGDYVLLTNPCYPVYFNSTILAGGLIHDLPLLPENKFLPDLTKIPNDILKRAKVLALNYPNNPTSAVIEDKKFLEEVVKFAKKYDLIVCYDNAYSEITFDDYVAPSFLEIDGGMDVGVEFNSCSKTYNMAGWRVGYMVGNKDIIAPVEKFKSFVDYGVFTAIQLTAAFAMSMPQDCVKQQVQVYRKRRDMLVDGLNKIKWLENEKIEKPKGTMYLWLPLPDGFKHMGSLEFAELLIQETGIAIAPGVGFGTYGEGYLRLALVTRDNRFHDVLLRLKKFFAQQRSKKGK
ncbi:MAG: LL-diaminopimelate aminotransferase [Elusimicrobiota bacterium]